jgi:signal recognition particle subunit SRP54
VGNPVDVARAAIEHARARQYDVVVVDTAGRLGIDTELMRQAADIRDAVRPDEVLFVVDAMIGQDAVTTAQAFLDGVGFDGVVLTKLDGDARGGAALSVAQITGRQVMFASNGEKLDDFDVFHPDRMASRILGMGDVLTLIEQAEKAFDAKRPRRWPRSSRPATTSPSRTSWPDAGRSARWARCPSCSGCSRAWGSSATRSTTSTSASSTGSPRSSSR